MSRTAAAVPSLVIITIAGLIACSVFFGCWHDKPDGSAKTGTVANKTGTVANKTKRQPPVKDWPRPAFALVISGEQKGYLEVCGCTAENQLGGMAHRADLMKQLRKDRKWDLVGLELGGVIHRDRFQDQLKLQELLKAQQLLGYAAIGFGVPELVEFAAGSDFLLTLPNVSKEGDVKLPFVSANVRIHPSGKTDWFGPRQWRTISIGGKTIAVTSIFGKGKRVEILGNKESNSRLAILDPEKSLPDVIKQMKSKKPDLMVLLAYANLNGETKLLAQKFPEFDLIVSAGGPEDGIRKPILVGKTMIVNVGLKGKHVGVVGFYPDSKDKKLRYELVELDGHRFKDDPEMVEMMRRYQSAIKDNKAEVFADVRFGPHPSGATFVGVDSCKGCHEGEYDVWIESKHSQAYKSLIDGRPDTKGKWIERNFDPECLSCHVTGWRAQDMQRYDSGFLIEELADRVKKPSLYKNLKGQQCENCHGPGSRHVDLETRWAKDNKSVKEAVRTSARKAMHVAIQTPKSRRLCYSCHDLDNSPKFKIEKYWEDIAH